GSGEQHDGGEEEDADPVAAESPADRAEGEAEHGDDGPGLQDVPEHEEPRPHDGAPQLSSSVPSVSSSASPRGGQSGSGASQRLEQCREATFCSGMRMCPLSSTCATSST